MQQLGYFGSEVGRVPGAEEVPEPEGELVVFEAFFTTALRLPAHRFMAEVLQRFEVQVHQLTLNAVVALAKYVWAATEKCNADYFWYFRLYNGGWFCNQFCRPYH